MPATNTANTVDSVQSAPQTAEAESLQMGPAVITAADLGMVSCHHCATLWKDVEAHDRCGRCGARLHGRKPDSANRAWAFVVAACIMYIPANTLPVMTTASLFGEQQDTIMSGIIYFWASGSWALASIVFIASFLVPLFKLAALILLLITAQRHSKWRLLQRAKLYRLVEVTGRWSMLDVFVVTLLTGLVQIKGFATVYAGAGIAAFAAVVVLTMLASLSFDPRMTWDMAEAETKAGKRA
jgi:paraquat-inducible protein A